jgi:hypothetical protein
MPVLSNGKLGDACGRKPVWRQRKQTESSSSRSRSRDEGRPWYRSSLKSSLTYRVGRRRLCTIMNAMASILGLGSPLFASLLSGGCIVAHAYRVPRPIPLAKRP